MIRLYSVAFLFGLGVFLLNLPNSPSIEALGYAITDSVIVVGVAYGIIWIVKD